MSSPNLRNLPSVDLLKRQPVVRELLETTGPQRVLVWCRAAIRELRQGVEKNQITGDKDALLAMAVDRVAKLQHTEHSARMRPVINATGVLLHTNLGRAPLAPEAVAAMQQTAQYTNLEIDLADGRRSQRASYLVGLLAQLTGAESALAVNNCAAATILALHSLPPESEVIVSRGQLVEIGGGFRLPDVFRAAGVTLREVGTTNRTYVRDYEQAISERTGAIIRVHRSNFHQLGFVTEPSIAELVSLPKPDHVLVIDDVGSGLVSNLDEFGIDEPVVQDSLAAGADLCLFSGDKLFGGPQSGIAVGRQSAISAMAAHPMMRALRLDKTTLAALTATAEIHLNDRHGLPLYQCIRKPAQQIHETAQRLAAALANCGAKSRVVACQSQIGGGSLPHVALPSYALQLTGSQGSEPLAIALRTGEPAILGRQEDNHLLLDLRTVLGDQLSSIEERLVALCQSGQLAGASS